MLRMVRGYTPVGTFGTLYLPGGPKLRTVECPWKGNAPFESCVPEGVYELVEHVSGAPHIGQTWAWVNRKLRVTHYREPTSRRYAILFHIGNQVGELQGCAALGLDFNGMWGVSSSRVAMNKFRDWMNQHPDERELLVTHFVPEYP